MERIVARVRYTCAHLASINPTVKYNQRLDVYCRSTRSSHVTPRRSARSKTWLYIPHLALDTTESLLQRHAGQLRTALDAERVVCLPALDARYQLFVLALSRGRTAYAYVLLRGEHSRQTGQYHYIIVCPRFVQTGQRRTKN